MLIFVFVWSYLVVAMEIEFTRFTVEKSFFRFKMAITTVTHEHGITFSINIHWPAKLFCHSVAIGTLYGRITSTVYSGTHANRDTKQIHERYNSTAN